MEQTEHPLRFSPRYQAFLDFAHLAPEVDATSLKTYLFFLWVAGNFFTAQQEFYKRFDLSEGKIVVLLLLQQAPHHRLTPSELAEAAAVTRGTITGLLAGLERSGLVKRSEHPEDGRMFTIELTSQALDLFEQILPERFQRIGQLMDSLTEQEQHQLVTLLEKINQALPALSDP